MRADDIPDDELRELEVGRMPTGADLVRIRKELLKFVRLFGSAESVAEAERLVLVAERESMKKTAANSEVKIEKFTRNLRVTLKEGEVVERAKRSAFLLGEIQQKESERDAAKKQANAQIEELGAEMHRLSLEVRDGAAYRDVPCTRHYVYRVGIVEERRSDTNELLNDRPMTERERQLELEGLAGKKDASSEAKTLSDDVVKAEAVKKLVEAGAQVLPTEKKPRKPRKPKAQADASAQA